MSSLESRTHIIKPLVIKAAIPAALSAAAYVCAKIISKRSNSQQNLLQPENDTLLDCPDGENDLPCCEEQGGTNLKNEQISILKDKLLELEAQIENLRKRECDSEARFLRYQGKKEREILLTELRNSLMLEKAQAGFLLKEISMMKEESKRVEELVIEYIKHMEEMQRLKRENGFLQRKARKSWRREKQRIRVLRNKKLGIEERELELLSKNETIRRRDNLVQELTDQVAELKGVVDHLQREKIELFNEMELDQKISDSTNSQINRDITKEFEKVLKDFDQLKNSREEEAKELAYLKWSNACLRHELLRHHEQENAENTELAARMTNQENIIHNWNTGKHEQAEECNCVAIDTTKGRIIHSRRQRLVQKLKRWVEGEREGKNEVKSLGWSYGAEEVEGQFVPSRNSCSSV